MLVTQESLVCDLSSAKFEKLNKFILSFFPISHLAEFDRVYFTEWAPSCFGSSIVAFLGVQGSSLEQLCVKPKWRQQGVAGALLDRARNRLSYCEVTISKYSVDCDFLYNFFYWKGFDQREGEEPHQFQMVWDRETLRFGKN